MACWDSWQIILKFQRFVPYSSFLSSSACAVNPPSKLRFLATCKVFYRKALVFWNRPSLTHEIHFFLSSLLKFGRAHACLMLCITERSGLGCSRTLCCAFPHCLYRTCFCICAIISCAHKHAQGWHPPPRIGSSVFKGPGSGMLPRLGHFLVLLELSPPLPSLVRVDMGPHMRPKESVSSGG